MIDIEKLARECAIDDYYNESPISLKQFAEAYHKAMCEVEASSTEATVLRPPLKRLSDSRINELAYESINDVAGVSAGYTTQEQYFAGLIMDEMERINK